MKTNEERLNELLAHLDSLDHIHVDEIPQIDLYMDQVTTFMEKHLGELKRYPEDKVLTKTMINNYSKDGLISPIEGKKYSRGHIIEMLLVYAMKSTLSIGEIKRMLTGARGECGFSGADLADCYRRFLSCKEGNRVRTGETVRALLQNDALNIENDRDFFVALLDILSLSAYLKAAAQEMLTARYADPDLAEKEKKEREKAEKREREEKEKTEKLARKEEKAKNKKTEKPAATVAKTATHDTPSTAENKVR